MGTFPVKNEKVRGWTCRRSLGLVTRISDFCNSDAGFLRTSMSDLGPTTQMTITIFRESLLDHKNSLLAFLSWRGYCLVLFFPGNLYLLHLPIA